MSSEPSDPTEPSAPESEISDEAQPEPAKRGKKLATGLAFGIGSAAIVAALLYTSKNKDKGSQD